MVELGVCINDDIKGVPADAPALTTQSSWDPLAYYSARQQPLCLFFSPKTITGSILTGWPSCQKSSAL